MKNKNTIKKVRVYKFDWDDNILKLPTKIKVYKKGNPLYVSTSEYSELRNNPEYSIKDFADAFEDFRDYGLRGKNAFLEDTKTAIMNNHLAPSFMKFKEALIYCNFFAIITARGHSPNTIKKGVKMFINYALNPDEKIFFKERLKILFGDCSFDYLIDKYLSYQKYYPVSSDEFQKQFGSVYGADKPEIAKQIASKDFITYIEGVVSRMDNNDLRFVKGKGNGILEISVGFSDDDRKNIKSMLDFMNEMKKEKTNMKFIIYDTSNPDDIKKIII